MFFLHFLTIFSGFLSIPIPFLTSCTLCFPCVPVLSVAFYVVKSIAPSVSFWRDDAFFGTAVNKPHLIFSRGRRKAWGAIIKEYTCEFALAS